MLDALTEKEVTQSNRWTKFKHWTRNQSDNKTIRILKQFSPVLIVLIPLILSIYIHLLPMQLPSTDDWAKNAVYNYYTQQIGSQINAQYPNLPDANKNTLVKTEFDRFLEQNQAVVQQQIDQTSQQFKEQLMYESGDSKYVYLGDIDSYHWLREARKLLENGRNCDEIDYEKGICYTDLYTLAPLKEPFAVPLGEEKGNPYSWFIVYTYKFGKMFNEDFTLMQASFTVPLILSALSVLVAFLVGRVIAGNFAGLIASIMVAVNPIMLSRSIGSDNDPVNILLPLTAILLFIYTVDSKTILRKILFAVATGAVMAFYSWTWSGWWYIFDFFILTLIGVMGFQAIRNYLKHKKVSYVAKALKEPAIVLGTLIASGLVLTTVLTNLNTFLDFIKGPLWFTQTKIAALANYWPNVLVTVAEFNAGSISSIIGQMGGKILFFLGLMGLLFAITIRQHKIDRNQKAVLIIGAMIYLFLVSAYGTALNPVIFMALLTLPVIIGLLMLLKADHEVDVKLSILLMIWFVATTYASIKGVRFTLLMASAFSISFAITLAALYRSVSRYISQELKVQEIIPKVLVGLIILLLLINPVKAGFAITKNYVPNMNDAWYDSLKKIENQSNPDAIINSWWDFGHWFKYIADRRVTLDGASQGGPPLHWLGKLMVTKDEKLSVGILRMLDCGSNTAFDKLNPILKDTSKSIEILDKIVTQSKEAAQKTLTNAGLTKTQAEEVLKYTHCEAPENFFITSEDMVGKAGVWAHFGSWDFTRAEMYTKVKGISHDEGIKILTNKEYNLSKEEAEKIYYEIQTQDDNQWITDWPGYMSSVQPCQEQGDSLYCMQAISNGQQLPIVINKTTMEASIPAQESYYPTSLVYITNEGTEEKNYTKNTLPLSVILIPRIGGYSTLIAHPTLANSIFTRLFYLDGQGLKYFDKFSDADGITGGRVIVWKVDWEGKTPNEIFTIEKPEDKQQTDEEEDEDVPDNSSVQ